MAQKDESPNASEGPYWSEELLAVLVVGLGDETQARETLEGIIQQALSGRALQGISLRRCRGAPGTHVASGPRPHALTATDGNQGLGVLGGVGKRQRAFGVFAGRRAQRGTSAGGGGGGGRNHATAIVTRGGCALHPTPSPPFPPAPPRGWPACPHGGGGGGGRGLSLRYWMEVELNQNLNSRVNLPRTSSL